MEYVYQFICLQPNVWLSGSSDPVWAISYILDFYPHGAVGFVIEVIVGKNVITKIMS